jgi:uncharacterized membrane protein (DUF485 family)
LDRALPEMTTATKFMLTVLIGAIAAALFALYFLSTAQQSPRETTLIAIILTILSVISTWIASHWYAKQNQEKRIDEIKKDSMKNLRMYALKAAEKLLNSSNELTRLSSYLQEGLERLDSQIKCNT